MTPRIEVRPVGVVVLVVGAMETEVDASVGLWRLKRRVQSDFGGDVEISGVRATWMRKHGGTAHLWDTSLDATLCGRNPDGELWPSGHLDRVARCGGCTEVLEVCGDGVVADPGPVEFRECSTSAGGKVHLTRNGGRTLCGHAAAGEADGGDTCSQCRTVAVARSGGRYEVAT